MWASWACDLPGPWSVLPKALSVPGAAGAGACGVIDGSGWFPEAETRPAFSRPAPGATHPDAVQGAAWRGHPGRQLRRVTVPAGPGPVRPASSSPGSCSPWTLLSLLFTHFMRDGGLLCVAK